MRYISLFSGIEASSVAWEPLGWEPVCFAELDEFPSAVLAERFPDVPNVGDVTKAKWRRFKGKCDVIVGGNPCQSFSVAGKREGLQGESGLMFEYIRAVREVRPRWFLWENVPGALSSECGEAFRQLLSEMDALGYGLAWRVLDAQFFGVAQRRERVFLVGRLGERPPVEVLFDGDGVQWHFAQGREKRAELAARAGRGPASAGFKFHQGAGAGGVGAEDESSPTLTADWHNPAVYPINEQIATRANALGEGTGLGVGSDGDPGYTLQAAHPHMVACNSNGQDLCGALAARDHKGVGSQYVREGKVVAFAQNTRDEVRIQGDGTLSGALSANPGMKQTTYVCETAQSGSNGLGVGEADVAPTVSTAPSSAVAYRPIAMADCAARAAIDVDMVGTLHVGGDAPTVAT